MAGVKAYLDGVREWATRPYMAPVEECLTSVDESVEEVFVGSWVKSVALLPDLNKAIVGMISEEVLVVDVGLAEVVKRYVGHTESVQSVAVSRDGRRMAAVRCGRWGGSRLASCRS